jgi:riboflavin biosynthesis pyrimidine reductase
MQLYPGPPRERILEGLYLPLRLNTISEDNRTHVYTNFITSLDGRIAIEQPITGARGVPRSITNSRDWRLYQELAARADILLVSARYLRQLVRGEAQDSLPISDAPVFADLLAWRIQQSLPSQPAIVILSASLELSLTGLCATSDRPVYVATGKKADAEAVSKIEQSGARMLYAGEGRAVEGKQLVEQLEMQGFRSIYSIAGPGVLATLLRANVLDRIYLTQVHRLIGGASYDTLLEGDLLKPPADFSLQALYYDSNSDKRCGQFFSIYEKIAPATSEKGCDEV